MSLNFDFSDVSFHQPPSQGGVFNVELKEVTGYTSNSGNPRISVVGVVTEGPEKGRTIKDGINCPQSSDDSVKRVWMRFFVCLGLDPAEVAQTFQLKGKNIGVDKIADAVREAVVGRSGFCEYHPPVEEDGWPTRKWLTNGQARAKVALAADVAAIADTNVDPLDAMINV
jgi:hypothetical protein